MSVDISIKNIGPIVEFEYTMDAYGLHVLRGRNGGGKTTTLRTIQLATDGKMDVRPQKRDGSARGEATVAGQTIRISKKVRTEGELSIESLGEVSIADLHTPKFEKAVTRDAHRIKALARIAGVKADASLFWPLLDGQERFESIVPVDALKTDDLVDMAARVKRAIERAAVSVEERKTTELANARAQTAIAEPVDTDAPHDADELQAVLERAIRAHSEAKAKLAATEDSARTAKDANARYSEAKARLEAIGGGMTVAEALTKLDAEEASVAAILAQVDRLQAKLDVANQTLREVRATRDAAKGTWEAAKREESLNYELKAAIDAGMVEGPTDDDIELAHDAVHDAAVDVEAAKSAVTAGVKIRQAIEAKAKAAKHMEAADALAERARRLRDAAADTANVLTQSIAQIAGCPLRVKLSDEGDPRLVLSTERSEHECFDELSDGLKWMHIMRIAAASNRLIVLPQAAFGELSDSLKAQLDALAKENSCYIITAVAVDCALHGAPWSQVAVAVAE